MIDLRSDTVTKPTESMRVAMANALVDDDVYGDDPTITLLEKLAAQLTGKEAALFVPSGTFGNQLAVFTHCVRGQEVILAEDCHIVEHEAGAAAIIAGVQLRTLPSQFGCLNPQQVEKTIRKEEDIHFPSTGLICLENAHSSGKTLPLSEMKAIYEVAQKYHIPLHLDGARLFNAVTYLGGEITEVTQYCDSIMFCLSKGLAAPVGSLLVGSSEFIAKARKKRKIMGGGMRQVGILGAAGLIALTEMRLRLGEDHENAKYLANQLMFIPEVEVLSEQLEVNLVFMKVPKTWDSHKMAQFFKDAGIKINGPEDGVLRLVTHYEVSKSHIEKTVQVFKEFVAFWKTQEETI